MHSAARKPVVGVILGGRSVEHDVSVVTGHQILRAFDRTRYEVLPLYIDREGRWFAGEPLWDLKHYAGEITRMAGVAEVVLSPNVRQHGIIVRPIPSGLFARPQVKRLDFVFPTLHGSHGEDGTLQGLLELADIPYVGCGVLASALANDKIIAKQLLQQAGIPVVPGIALARHEWQRDPDAMLARIHAEVGPVVFVKPATLGSSIGVAKADHAALLAASLEVAFSLDRRVLIETALSPMVEINCAVLGDASDLQVSVLEQPVSWDTFLSYEEKYLRGGEGMKSADRIIPAPISAELTERIQRYARQAFRAIDGRGIARMDFMLRTDTNEVFLNEINTMPGSLALYLWEATDLAAVQVIDRLLDIARAAAAEKRRNTYNYKTNLISLSAERGTKGVKARSAPANAR
jgi:D-alanine-D-alanine ligase